MHEGDDKSKPLRYQLKSTCPVGDSDRFTLTEFADANRQLVVRGPGVEDFCLINDQTGGFSGRLEEQWEPLWGRSFREPRF
eukprot:1188391-Prorocentrum_minimum.AAC.3